MGDKKGMSMDLDTLSVLNLGDDEEELDTGVDETTDTTASEDTSIASEESTDATTPDVGTEDTTGTEDVATATTEGDTQAEETTETNFDAMVNELLRQGEELEQQVQEVSDVAEDLDNPELMQVISTLQDMVAENKVTIDEVSKERDVRKNKYMERYGEDTDMSVYKPEITILEENPKLRSLLKYWNNGNEKVAEKVTKLLSDLFYDRTWQDISQILEEKDRTAASAVLNNAPSETELSPDLEPEEEDEITRDDSVNNILWI